MHVFVTGGSGFVGSSVIPVLIASGHTVKALARSDASVNAVKSLGATPVLGGQADLDILSKAANEADAVIHLSFDHLAAFRGDPIKACDEDYAAISTTCDALLASGKNKTFLGTSGLLGCDGPDEKSHLRPNPRLPRHLSDELVASYAGKGLRCLTIRLAPITHGPDRMHPFIATQISIAKKNGVAAYVGEGTACWPAVHVQDAAKLYALALEKGPSGVNLHAVGESGYPTKSITEFIAKKLNVGTKSLTPQEAMTDYGVIGNLMGLGQKSTALLTKEWTGWEPKEYGLFEEMEQNYTF